MKFSTRYTLWLLLPPMFIAVPLAFLFFLQVVQMDARETWRLAVTVAVGVLIGAVFFSRFVLSHASAVEKAVGDGRDVSAATSSCLIRTEIAGLTFWGGSGLVLMVVCTLWRGQSLFALQGYVLSALVMVTPSMAWTYWTGKSMLLRFTDGIEGVRYQARYFSFRAKIAMVVVGFFVVSAGVMVLVIAARVSDRLEASSLESAEPAFQAILADVNSGSGAPRERLSAAAALLPENGGLALIRSGTVIASIGEEPALQEISAIQRLGGGNSLSFAGDRAIRFEPMTDGSILALSMASPFHATAVEIELYGLLVAVITALMFLLAMHFLAEDLTRPVRHLILASERMAAGDFTGNPSVFADDEVGRLTVSFFETRDNLRRLIGRVGGSGVSVTRGVEVIQEGTSMLMNSAREQGEQIEQSNLALEEVKLGAEEVMRAASEVSSFTQDSASRAIELESSASEIARNVNQLFESVEKISSSTSQIDASAVEMARRTDFLSQVGEQVLSYVSEMDATVEQFRQATETTAEMSGRMRELADAGGASVEDTVEGIKVAQEATRRTAGMLNNLQGSISQINMVLTVIEELAEKTNLLSLNAAIIAAQAGEHEFGFSVVADEIRELADRTRKSTREIHGIIRAIRPAAEAAVTAMNDGVTQVDQSVGLAAKAVSSLSEIRQSAEQTFENTLRVAKSIEQHAEASRQLLEVASGMTDDIGAITSATGSQAEATRYVARESERVRDIALQVRNATEEQSRAASGISRAMEQIAAGELVMRTQLENQFQSTEQIASSARVTLEISRRNDSIAQEFQAQLQELSRSGRQFQSELGRFRLEARDERSATSPAVERREPGSGRPRRPAMETV